MKQDWPSRPTQILKILFILSEKTPPTARVKHGTHGTHGRGLFLATDTADFRGFFGLGLACADDYGWLIWKTEFAALPDQKRIWWQRGETGNRWTRTGDENG